MRMAFMKLLGCSRLFCLAAVVQAVPSQFQYSVEDHLCLSAHMCALVHGVPQMHLYARSQTKVHQFLLPLRSRCVQVTK